MTATARHHIPSAAPQVILRPAPAVACEPAALLIAASTGAVSALSTFLTPIARRIDAPIIIATQLSAYITPMVAERLQQVMGKRCREAIEGDVLFPGAMLLVPGDSQARIARCPAGRMIHLDRAEPLSLTRPVADPLFETAAAAFGPRLLAVVLTGAGEDGHAGAARIVEAGGRVIVQDEASSADWSMPGAVAHAGYAEAVKPIKELSQLTLRLMNGDVA